MSADYVNGKTAVYGIIGNPVGHSFSPTIHNICANIMNINLIYCPFRVEQNDIENSIRGAHALNIRGLNVTVPHKISVMKYLCGIDTLAEQINAVNTLKYTDDGYIGYNTDIIGMTAAFKEENVEIKGKNVLLLGAGGAGCAGAFSAASNGAAGLVIANRTLEKAEKLKNQVLKYYDFPVSAVSINGLDNTRRYDIIINATTVGFGNQKGISPVGKEMVKNAEVVFDAIYAPLKTKLLEYAEELSVKAINGFDMLIYQALAAEEIWLDMKFESKKKKEIKDKLKEFYINNIL